MKQTAIQEMINIIQMDMNNRVEISMDVFMGMLKKAKEVEKQQIIDAHGIKTKSINQDQAEIITGSQYYNRTFKQ
jgi:hypothetical protein